VRVEAFFPDPAPPGSPKWLAAQYVYNEVAAGREPEDAIKEAEEIYSILMARLEG